MSKSAIIHIDSLSDLNKNLSGDKPAVIDFYATWCGPCRVIAPTFEQLSTKYKNVTFLKCDVDKASDVSSRYQVTAMPTFVFLKGTTEVERVRGADPNKLNAAIERLSSGSSGSTGAFSGKGQTLGGGPVPAAIPGADTPSVINLSPQAKVLLGLVGAYLVLWYFS